MDRGDPDYIPWPMGLAVFLMMIAVAGLFFGGACGRPLLGVACSLGVFGSIAAVGLVYDRVKHGRWFVG